jgi:uncharacterized membrane protein
MHHCCRLRLVSTVSALALAALTMLVLLVRADDSYAAPAPQVSVSRAQSDPRWVQGHVVVDAPPDAVFARLAQVDQWPSLFTDIAKMKVKTRSTGHWTIELETRTLGHGTLPYKVDVGPGRHLRLWTDGRGVRADGETFVREGPTASQSEVTYQLFIELSGIPAIAVPERVLRPKQEHMVVSQLADLGRGFP